MQMRTAITCAAAMLAVIAVNVSAEAAGWRHGGWYGGYGGYGGYGYGGYAAVVPASADYGYFWGPPSRPGLYGGGF